MQSHEKGIKALEVMPNLMPDVSTHQTHKIPLAAACPVSGNPKQGSTLVIQYAPKLWHLEVYSLRAFADQFVGGLSYPHMAPDEYAVRDQEHMIQYVAQACADAVGVQVMAKAQLILSDGVSTSEMMLECVALPIPKNYGKTKISSFAVDATALQLRLAENEVSR